MNPGKSPSLNQNYDTHAAPNILNVEMFISDVFTRPDIWNRNLERNAPSISNLWIELAAKHNRTVEQLKRKWSLLREKFRQELKKIPRSVDNSFVIHPRNIISNWRHYRSMLFMADQITLKPFNEIVPFNLYQHLPIDNFHPKEEPIDASVLSAQKTIQPVKQEAIDASVLSAEEIIQPVKQEPIDASVLSVEEIIQLVEQEAIDDTISVNKNKRRFESHEDEYDDLTMKRRKEGLCENGFSTEDFDADHNQDNEVTNAVNNEVPQESQSESDNDFHYDNKFLMIFTEYIHHVDRVRKLKLVSQVHNILLKEIAEML